MMNLKRIRKLNQHDEQQGTIIYWMQREHRVQDNWALLYAQQLADKNKAKLIVVFCLRTHAVDFTERLISFMLGGLKEVENDLTKLNIPFYFLVGDPSEEIPDFVKKQNAGALVTEFHSLKTERGWRDVIAKKISTSMYEVDARNIIPCWIASPKQEFGAYTFRPKYLKQLPYFLEEFPEPVKQTGNVPSVNPVDWAAIDKQISKDTSVSKLTRLKPGTKAAQKILRDFLFDRLPAYHEDRNDPAKDGQSGLSPYLHFGHISAQRVLLEIQKKKNNKAAEDAFVEELTVRRELSDNFCFYNKSYDTPEGFPDWAKHTLEYHLHDKREYVYAVHELEDAQTHDDLWNAAQMEAVKTGKMHGWLRMYWAKKILEWSNSPAEAMKQAIFLMDKWFIDGREPNGFTGIAWAIGGVHDRAWSEREIFGKVRYMNYNGAKRKFDIRKYIQKISSL